MSRPRLDAPTNPLTAAPRSSAGQALLERFAQDSCSGPRELERLRQIAWDVGRREIPGDIVECGVMNGGSAAVLASGLPGRRLWLYDSFEGLPEPTPRDGPRARTWGGRCRGSESRVRGVLALAGVEMPTIVKGWYRDTFSDRTAPAPEAVALLHVDADWFDSVLLSLERFYDLIADGGVVVLGDFGYWEGCREAFYAFCRTRGLEPLIERFGHSHAWWVKGRTNNREYVGRWDMP